MPDQHPISSAIKISVGGNDLQESMIANVAEIVVDQHVHLPGMFTIRLYDSRFELIDSDTFALTKEVTIKVSDADERSHTLMKGEITALEPIFDEGMVPELMVRGYQKSHRLYRETKTKAYLNIRDSEMAEEIASDAGLTPETDRTSMVYDHVYRHNQSGMSFLMQRAWRIGYECFVDEDKLYFRKPPNVTSSTSLTWGDDLLTFHPRMTVAEQVGEVLVKGWDPEKLEAIVGRANDGKLYPEVGERKKGSDWDSPLGTGKLIVVDQPVVNQSEADTLAQARLNELSGAFVQADGTAYRRPDLKAGMCIDLQSLGSRFSGKYLVTSATHVYSPEGLRTQFEVMGARTGSLLDLTNHEPPLTRWPGAVTAVVTNSDDPKKWGRVKVKFPWMADDAESDWCRLVGPGGGPEAGFYAVPDLEDEVLVVFEHGDFSRPYVLGGLWNGKHAVPPTAASASGGDQPKLRTWHSRTGHAITMNDIDGEKKVEIKTAGGHTITMDDDGSKIEINSSNGLKITLDDGGNKTTIEGSNEVQIKSNTNMKLEAGANMEIKATGKMDIQASGPVTVKGATVALN